MGGARSKHTEEEDDSDEEEDDEEHEDSEEALPAAPFAWLVCCSKEPSNASIANFLRSDDVKLATRPKVILADNVGRAVRDYFDIYKTDSLGEGGFATVCQGRNKRTGAIRAIKTMAKSSLCKREVDGMMRLDHPNIIKLFQTFEDNNYMYLVMEICHGKDLYDRIIEEGQFSELKAATVMRQMFRAVRYMHEAGVCHRDLKPENFLFLTKDAITHNSLKVIDFGICALYYPPHGTFHTKTGTPQYVAPEVLSSWFRKGYGPECDEWSCGVVLYVLLSGGLPFKGRDDAETMDKVKSEEVAFRSSRWSGVSDAAKDLIKRLLRKDPGRRLRAERALEDEWVTGQAIRPSAAPLQSQHIASLRAFQSENKLKKVALGVVAWNCDEAQIDALRDVFMDLDKNGDGLLTTAELRDGLVASGVGANSEDLSEIMAAVDYDGSGEIDYTEFLAATLEQKLVLQESACKAAFRVFDKDDDGRISKEELERVLADRNVLKAHGTDQITELMQEFDINGDGYIDFQEFMAMMRK